MLEIIIWASRRFDIVTLLFTYNTLTSNVQLDFFLVPALFLLTASTH